MIAGKGFSEPANKPLRLFLGYRCDDGHAPVRPSLANDPVPQKDEAVIDVGDMGFLHIQHQFQLAFQKGATSLADFAAARWRVRRAGLGTPPGTPRRCQPW